MKRIIKKSENSKSLDKYSFGSSQEGIEKLDVSNIMGDMFGGEQNPTGNNYMKAMQVFQGLASSLSSSAIANAIDTIKYKGEEYRPVTMNTNRIMGNGGIIPNSNVEVEGNEIAETPAGEILQFTGPKHEQGGIETNLPQGTKIYSDRISIDGKTMQQRKKSRENRLSKVFKIFDKDKTNQINKNTVKRVQQINEQEEQLDLMLQGIIGDIYNSSKQKFPLGTPPEGISPIAGDTKMPLSGFEIWKKLFSSNSGIEPTQDMYKEFFKNSKFVDTPVGLFQNWVNDTYPNSLPKYGVDNKWGDETQAAYDKYGLEYQKLLDGSGATQPLPSKPALPFPLKKPEYNLNTLKKDNNNPNQVDINTNMDFTQGDKLGIAGIMQGALSPFFTTLANRAGDKPNLNHFQDFGIDGLKANNDAKTIISGLKNQALQDVTLGEDAAIERNRNSTRGLSTQRALDLVTYMGGLDASNKVYNNYATQMANLFGIQSNLENQQDQMVMAGAKDKAFEDKADRDNFFTQINEDMSNISTQTQQLGKNLNIHKGNNDFLSLLPELSKYGLGIVYDENGKPIVTKVK